MTPPVVFHSFTLPFTPVTPVYRSRTGTGSPYSRQLLFRDCTAVLNPRHTGDADTVNPRWHSGSFEHVQVSAVPPRRSAVLIVFRGATAINNGTTVEPRTAIMVVTHRFMLYKHRSATAPPVWRGYYWHALICCDTTGHIRGKGKRVALQLSRRQTPPSW